MAPNADCPIYGRNSGKFATNLLRFLHIPPKPHIFQFIELDYFTSFGGCFDSRALPPIVWKERAKA